MKKLTHKQILSYSIAAVLVFIGASLFLSYFTSFRDPVTASFKRLYPAAIIGSRVVSVNDLEQAQDIGKKLGLTAQQARDRQIMNEKTYDLAKKLHVKLNSDAQADEFRFYTVGHETEYEELLKKSFGGSEHWFTKYVVVPKMTDAALRAKYYNDIKNTDPAFQKAKSVLERISKGEKFEDLARTESADKASGQLGGDLGYYESGQILPELENQISISTMGEVRKDIIVTRLGYHVVYPVEYSMVDNKKVWHAKHILFVPDGYDQWLSKQLAAIKVTNISR